MGLPMLESSRKTISKGLRFAVFNRDKHTCQYCGRQAPETKLTVDHIIPVSAGGTSEPDNLLAACADCNAGKGAGLSLRTVDNADLASRLQASKERRKILRATLKADRECIKMRTERTWGIAKHWIALFQRTPKEGEQWTIETRFFSMLGGILEWAPLEKIIGVMEECASKWHGRYLNSEMDAIRYFCGCMRHYRQEHAPETLSIHSNEGGDVA